MGERRAASGKLTQEFGKYQGQKAAIFTEKSPTVGLRELPLAAHPRKNRPWQTHDNAQTPRVWVIYALRNELFTLGAWGWSHE